jgi:hypothetical protein
MYSTQVRRETLDLLELERRHQTHAVLANGGYFQSDKGIKAREAELKRIQDYFTKACNEVRDPGAIERADEAFRNNPFFRASLNAMEKLRWDYESARSEQMARVEHAIK